MPEVVPLIRPRAQRSDAQLREPDVERDRQRCRDYLLGHRWCTGVLEALVAYSVPTKVSVFLVRIDAEPDVDEWLWCIVGDLPSAYLVLDECDGPASALEAYAELMTDWVESVREGDEDAEVFPVEAPRTEANAEALASRVAFLRAEVIPDAAAWWAGV